MAQMSLHNKLLNQQQETINLFTESLEKEISQNSKWAKSSKRLLFKSAPVAFQKSILGQVEELIEKEKENASKLQGTGGITKRGHGDCRRTVPQAR